MYFSGVPRGDWPQAVDAQSPTQPEEGVISVSSESEGTNAGQMESPSLVLEKVQGKRAVVDGLA